jgi:hypothetical protein
MGGLEVCGLAQVMEGKVAGVLLAGVMFQYLHTHTHAHTHPPPPVKSENPPFTGPAQKMFGIFVLFVIIMRFNVFFLFITL